MAARDINGAGVAVTALGLVVAWAGFRNVPVLAAFKDLAMGKAPEPRPKPMPEDIAFALGGSLFDAGKIPAAGSSAQILAMAQQVAATPAGRANYCWGGGHSGSPCSARCFDCSGYVSCVLNRLGLLKGSMVTTQFLAWRGATTVAWEHRQPGDLLVNTGHMGIVADDARMWNAACTACGPVKLSPYSRRYTVRRVLVGGAGGTPSSGAGRRTPAPNFGQV